MALPLDTRVSYAIVVGSLVTADRSVEEAELADLRALCADLEIPPERADEVLDAARAPSQDVILGELRELRTSPLRFTLLTDMVVLGFADGTYTMAERKRVRAYATVVGVDEDQVVAIEQKVIQRTQERRAIEHVVEVYKPKKEPLPPWAQFVPVLYAAVVTAAAILVVMPPGRVDALKFTTALSRLALGNGPIAGFFAMMVIAILSWAGATLVVARYLGHPDRVAP